MRVIIEELKTGIGVDGQVGEVGWATDGYYSRYWGGRRWQQLQEQNRVARMLDRRGNLVPLV